MADIRVDIGNGKILTPTTARTSVEQPGLQTGTWAAAIFKVVDAMRGRSAD
ncbi:MAG: hypothetical protein IT337_09430 [Thermomicrobiales bacterium]|nr:hypothetical protein [Thermomicrobiales bacterium]